MIKIRTGFLILWYSGLGYLSLGAAYTQSAVPIQQGDSLLQVVEVKGLLNQVFQPATKIQRFDSTILSQHIGQNLAQLLQQKSTLAIRQYGAGQLSTISFRGTGSSHTAVLWNGLNINSPTLGLTDFSSIPLQALEHVNIVYGGGSPVYGSDALGGTVQLGSQSKGWKPSKQAVIQLESGSFGARGTTAKVKIADSTKYLTLTPYYQEAENNFKFRASSRKNQKLTNENSAFQQYGGTLSAGVKPSANASVMLDIWVQRASRQTQPTIQKIGYRTSYDPDQDTKFLRSNLAYNYASAKNETNVQLGYLWDQSEQYGTYTAGQLITKGQYSIELNNTLELAVGGALNHKSAQNPNYAISEIWAAAYGHARYQPLADLELAASLRYASVLTKSNILLPSIQAKYHIPHTGISLAAQANRHFRFPALNDRYWPEVGVPELKPEDGWQGEAGIEWNNTNGVNVDLRAYYMDISNWILWAPSISGLWQPANIQTVVSKGLEFSAGYTVNLIKLSGQLAYVQAQNTGVVPELISVANQQLPYTPKLKANAAATLNFTKQMALYLSADYTSRRFTSSVESKAQSLPYFYLLHAGIQYSFSWGRHGIALNGRINNIVNQQYQSYGNWAMPGRSVNLTLAYYINSI